MHQRDCGMPDWQGPFDMAYRIAMIAAGALCPVASIILVI
jgi:hypothetical protein